MSRQLWWEPLTRPGRCQSNGAHPHAYKKQPREHQRPRARRTERANRAWRGSLRGSSCGRARREGLVALQAQEGTPLVVISPSEGAELWHPGRKL